MAFISNSSPYEYANQSFSCDRRNVADSQFDRWKYKNSNTQLNASNISYPTNNGIGTASIQSMPNNNVSNDVAAFSAGASGSSGGGSGATLVPRLLGSGIAGFSELLLFHPVDTVAKRLMSNTSKLHFTAASINSVVFKHAANEGLFSKWKSLFPGLGFAAGYKVLQRVYKFGGQPYVKDWIQDSSFGKKYGKLVTASVSGSIMGVGEVILLPLDVLKIKSQTNPEVLKGRGVLDIFMKEGRGLYRGAGWTAARNAPGSFALFGGSAFVHHVVCGLEDTRNATVMQNFMASMFGAICSIAISAPLDVVKTRIQNKPFDAPETGVQIVTKLIRDEGFSAFFKGLTPKIIVVGPKLIFSFTVAQTMISYFEKNM